MPDATLWETASCPICGMSGCKVTLKKTQATRYEPQRDLGLSGYCRACQVSFKVDGSQMRLETDRKERMAHYWPTNAPTFDAS